MNCEGVEARMYVVSVARAEWSSRSDVTVLRDTVFDVYGIPEGHGCHPCPQGESILVAKKRQTCLK